MNSRVRVVSIFALASALIACSKAPVTVPGGAVQQKQVAPPSPVPTPEPSPKPPLPPQENPEAAQIRQWLQSAQPKSELVDLPPFFREVATGAETVEQRGTSCMSIQKRRAESSTDEFVTFDPNAGVLWPGSLIQTASADTGTLDALSVGRAPQRLGITGRARRKNGQPLGQASVVLQVPSGSAYEDVRQQLVGDGFLPQGNWSHAQADYKSIDQSFVQLGMKASWLSADVQAALSVEKSENESALVYDFKQQYYTVSMDAPESPEKVFSRDVKLSDLTAVASPYRNPIGYVASVTYGRRILLVVKSAASREKLRAAMDAHVGYVTGGSGLQASDEQSRILEQSDIRLFVVGDRPESQTHLLGSGFVNKLAALRRVFDDASSEELVQFGVPISYRINYLGSNHTMRIGLTSDFELTEKKSDVPSIENLQVAYEVADDDKDGNSLLTTSLVKNGSVLAIRKDVGATWTDHSWTPNLPFERSPRFLLQDFQGSVLRVCINPNGKDAFRFGVQLTGLLSAGGIYQHLSRGHWVSQERNCADIPLTKLNGPLGCQSGE